MLRTTALSILWISLALPGCDKSKDSDSAEGKPPASTINKEPTPIDQTTSPKDNELPKFVGDPVEQSADFPKEQWVRTTTFDGKPFLGFTYVDRSKGNSIKGEPTDGLSPDELSKKLGGPPSYTLSPIPAGHAMTPLSPEEVKELGLPTPPDWLSFFK